MNSIPQNIRYLPHTLDTRYHAVKTYRNGTSVAPLSVGDTKSQKLLCVGINSSMGQSLYVTNPIAL
ncbi:hypothetical protein FOA32_001478 [Streptococcus sinensis]|nr:hypothetical protein [Streptococcus sinensis]